MTSIISISQVELAQRRQKLRRQRKLKWFQTSWRTLAVSGLAGSVVWVSTLPIWLVGKDQVVIEGNEFIPEETLRELLPLQTPQFVLKIDPRSIAQTLKTNAPIADAKVDRRLFPPGLIIQVKERLPVAIALPVGSANLPANVPASKTSTIVQPFPSGTQLLDESGARFPLDNYTSLDLSLRLPSLKILGKPEYYHLYWTKLYQAVSQSPVKIFEIDWRDPANLVLKTELGTVHCGPYQSHFSKQLSTLDRLRHLSNRINASEIAYIDLRNPETPSIELNRPKNPAKANPAENESP
jgi:cell division protein FtsQ